jgi:hypothetical protein
METTLFDAGGVAAAYVADDGSTIYLWDGSPVAYIDGDDVYGFNGQHLGWWQSGKVFDSNGRATGFVRDACPRSTQSEHSKSSKRSAPSRYSQQSAPSRPSFSSGASSVGLALFLQSGR